MTAEVVASPPILCPNYGFRRLCRAQLSATALACKPPFAARVRMVAPGRGRRCRAAIRCVRYSSNIGSRRLIGGGRRDPRLDLGPKPFVLVNLRRFLRGGPIVKLERRTAPVDLDKWWNTPVEQRPDWVLISQILDRPVSPRSRPRSTRTAPCAPSRAHSPNRRPRNSRATSADP